MAVTIKLTADPETGAGVDYNALMVTYFQDFTMQGWPYILGGSNAFQGNEIVLLDAWEADRADTKALILDGVKFNYYFASHTLAGKLTSLRLSTLGDSYDADTQSFDQAANGRIANVSTAIEITGLSVTGQKFHNLVAALMGGVDGGSTAANASPLRAAVAAQPQILRGSTGDDSYSGTRYADTAYGKAGDDTLKGQAGNDRLIGGIGADSLYGGAGRDTFVYGATADSTPALADTVFDFRSGIDKINLSAIDANVLAAKNQAFAFVGTKAFSGAAGELRYQAIDGDVFVYGDTNGDKVADLAIHIDNLAAIVKGDFVL